VRKAQIHRLPRQLRRHNQKIPESRPWKPEADRKQAEADAVEQEKVAKLEAEKNYDALKKLHEDKIEAMKSEHQTEIMKRDLSLELRAANVTDPYFTRVAVMDYDGTKPISDYVSELQNNEANAKYFAEPGRSVHTPPATAPVSLSSKKPSKSTLDQIYKSGTPEEKQEARAYEAQYFDTHGRMPE
jgi:hypothetical protein